VRAVARVALLAVAALQSWVFRHETSPDGVAYLDLSDAIVRGEPGQLVNGYWSPLYPVLIGFLRAVISSTALAAPQWEFAIVHVANLIAFALALLAFEWFLGAVDEAGAQWGQALLHSPLGRGAAYALFGIGALDMISLKGPVPDLLLTAACFAVFAFALRVYRDPAKPRAAMALGGALALGALAKSILFPLGVVVLATIAWALRRSGRGAVAIAAGLFAAGTLPWVAAVSASVGRPSTGETGALNYAWYVNGRQPPNTGVMPALAAPAESLPLDGLAVMPDGRGTNPLWYDPARWHRDVRPTFSLSQQRPRLIHSAGYYAYVLAPFVLMLVAIVAAARWSDLRRTWERTYVVVVPCLAGVAAYSMVYTTSRYIAPFLVAGCVVVGAAFPRGAPLAATRLVAALPVTLLALAAMSPLRGRLWLAGGVAFTAAAWLTLHRNAGDERWHGLRRLFAVAVIVAAALPALLMGVAALRAPRGDPNPQWATAQRLMAGIPAGSRIAVMGNPESSGWARLARYRIVAVIPPERVDAFKKLSDADRSRIVEAFRRAGAVELVEIAP
jgi:hypothetical protein